MAPCNSNGNGSAPTADDHTLANLLTTMAQQQPLPKKRGSNAAGARSSERAAAAPSSKKGGKKNADETPVTADKNVDSSATAKGKADGNKTNGTGPSTRNLSASIASQPHQQAPQPPTWNGRTGSAAQASTTIDPSATVGTTNASANPAGRNESRASSENGSDADYSEDNDESYTANATAPAATNGKSKGKKNQARAAKEASTTGASTGNANASTSAAGAAANGNGAAAANGDDEEGGEKLHTEQEWNRTRKDNHVRLLSAFLVDAKRLNTDPHPSCPQKEVERRRRETINEGINELKNIVPGCEKNKGSILSRAVQYIQQLKDREATLKDKEATLIEKWTLEKLLSDQTTSDLKREVEKLREELSIARMQNGKRGEVDGGGQHGGSEPKRSRLEGR
ncbi:BZ3500_MvSof-1268-A1-R1_Chr12-2g03869 [Microbotryum saponariae]|uniref:BZ3500_MvSof-1268-A1-R1_Chr12-2g03869 protein n=1 Tax=Microbotryum saponariae TaxID=289078 RepID=A0A2X0LEL1_9BASI|nr:BZ3500_MvSof-1268-A1-R1_Chr12-2g03869 [Microbotryum saponariae]